VKYLLWLSQDCKSIKEIVGALKGQGVDVDILLAQDGVYMADKGCIYVDELKEVGNVHALAPHIEERGISGRLAVKVNEVGYEQIVDLVMEKYDKVISL
jgi:sulfur relay protein TusB/DsrH